mgnify:CR=1 FL=1
MKMYVTTQVYHQFQATWKMIKKGPIKALLLTRVLVIPLISTLYPQAGGTGAGSPSLLECLLFIVIYFRMLIMRLFSMY